MSACTVTDPDTSPFIIDEENGIVYSPSSKRADTMAQRLREMRAQRENLSPTGMSTWFFFFFSFRCLEHLIYPIPISFFMQIFFLSASQMQGSPMDDSTRPSLGGTPTELNLLLLGEAIAL